MEIDKKSNNATLATLLKWGLGITAVYCLLPQDAKENLAGC